MNSLKFKLWTSICSWCSSEKFSFISPMELLHFHTSAQIRLKEKLMMICIQHTFIDYTFRKLSSWQCAGKSFMKSTCTCFQLFKPLFPMVDDFVSHFTFTWKQTVSKVSTIERNLVWEKKENLLDSGNWCNMPNTWNTTVRSN